MKKERLEKPDDSIHIEYTSIESILSDPSKRLKASELLRVCQVEVALTLIVLDKALDQTQ